MAKSPLNLKAALGLILVLPMTAIASDRADCLRAALRQVLHEAVRFRNFEGNVQMGDRGPMRQLINDGIVRAATIEHVPADLNDPRLKESNVETTLLLSPSGDAVRIHESPAIGQGRELLERNGSVYVVEVGVERSMQVGAESHGIRFQLPVHSSYQEGVEWSALSDEARSRLNRSLGTRQAVAGPYRGAAQIEVVPMRVRMPTGQVLPKWMIPHFEGLVSAGEMRQRD